MRSDAFETHVRTHGVEGPGGGMMPSPGSHARIRMCPICRFNFEKDHLEAVAMDRGKLPEAFDAEALSLAFIVDRLGPDDTQPPEPVETGFALAGEGT